MAPHRRGERGREVRPRPDSPGSLEPSAARGVAVEEGLVPDVDRLPTPAGFGTEASRSTQSFGLLDEYEVPAGSVAHLREASLSIESNGEAKISVAGTTYGPYTGSLDISVPLDPAILTPGSKVRVHHQSTDGNSTTTRAQLSVLEV